MKISLVRSYTHKVSLNKVFVYKVTGTKEEIQAYSDIQGENLKEDEDNNPLFFTTKCAGQDGKLIITSNGNVVVDMSEYDQAASLASQYGGNLGQELARAAAQKLMGRSHGSAVASSTPTPAPVASEETDLEL
jgi:hypothetical protein